MADQLGREYADGEVVIRQGEEGRCMFVIQEGSVGVARDGHRGIVLARPVQQRRQCVLVRLSVVDHDGQAEGARQLQLGAKGAPLHIVRGAVPVIIETDLPDRDDRR